MGSPWQRKGSERQLTLSSREKKIGGVCAGLARYFDMDVTLMRIVWLVFIFAPPGAGLIAYPLAWLVMPREQEQASATAEPSPASR